MKAANRIPGIIYFAASLMLLVAASPELGSALERKVPDSHPIELTALPRCTECHTEDTGVALKPIATFNHSADFISGHRFYASQSSRLCNACHKVSFCTDCHAYKDELKPSDKYSGSPERWLPHRGDYLFQHRIDGRLDPTSCYRCHGTQNNRLCRQCHK
jgi:cytochrome c553